jgi:hypothetical protein
MLKSSLAALMLVFSITLPALAQQDDVPTVKDQNGCKIYNPAPQKDESVKWSGGCRGGFADGKGVLEWYIGDRLEERYEGDLRGGWAEGSGVFISRQGTRYEGEWKRSQQHGQGVSRGPDGSSYDGEWRAGKPHGWGSYTGPDGDTITGDWENGELKSESSSRRI